MFKNLVFGLAIGVAALVCVGESQADSFVPGHCRPNGAYVQPYFRSSADGNFFNNYSTYPNVNPYTGSMGHKHFPTYSYPSPNQFRNHYTPYQNTRTVVTGLDFSSHSGIQTADRTAHFRP